MGKRPIIAPMLMRASILIQINTPTTNNLEKSSGALRATLLMRENKAPNRANNIIEPMNPNFSAYIAKIESLSASGK